MSTTAATSKPTVGSLRLLDLQGPAVYRFGQRPHELGNFGRIGSHLNRLGIDMGHAQHPPGVTPLVGKNQGDHIAGTASPGCAARPVQEGLGIGWWIHLDY